MVFPVTPFCRAKDAFKDACRRAIPLWLVPPAMVLVVQPLSLHPHAVFLFAGAYVFGGLLAAIARIVQFAQRNRLGAI